MPAQTTGRSSRGRVRDALQEHGIRLVADRGLEQISVADILAAANVSRRSFYGQFANKHELVASIINPTLQAGTELLSKLEQVAPEQLLPGVVDCYLALWERHGDALLAIAGLDSGVLPYIADQHRQFGATLLSVLRRAAAADLLLNDDAELTFRVISRTAVPLLRIYGTRPQGTALYRCSMLALLEKKHD